MIKLLTLLFTGVLGVAQITTLPSGGVAGAGDISGVTAGDGISGGGASGGVTVTNAAPLYACTDTGGDDTYACTPSGFPGSYTTGISLRIRMTTANTGAATIDAGPGAKAIKLPDGTTNPSNGDVVALKPMLVTYDSTGDGGSGAWILAVDSNTGSAAAIGFTATRTSGTVLTFSGPSTTAPLNIRGPGDTIYSFTASVVPTINAGTSVLFVYVDSAGTLRCGHNGLTFVSNSGCTLTGSITAFPAGSTPIYSWPATSGVWDSDSVDCSTPSTNPCNYQAVFTNPNVTGDLGIEVTNANLVRAVRGATGGLQRWWTAAGAPSGTISGSRAGDVYQNSSNGDQYLCYNASGDCAGVNSTNWVLVAFGGSTPGTGGNWYPFGAPSYTNSGAATVNVSPSGGAQGGMSWSFVAQAPTITRFIYKVSTGGAGGTGMIVGIYTASQSSAVCSAVASGTDVTATGTKILTMSCSGLVIGQPYKLVLSTSATGLLLKAYGDAYMWSMLNEAASAGTCGTTKACNAGYAASDDASTGTGGSIAFTTLSSVTWTPFTDGNGTYLPVVGFGN
jgi:hypothetical protein